MTFPSRRRIFRRHVSGAVRLPGAVLTFSGLAAMAVVWWVQDGLGIMPCGLCLWERWPWRFMLIIGLLAVIVPRRVARTVAAFGALPVIAALGLSGLHLGVEWSWWPSPLPECLAPHFSGGSIAERLASMPLRPGKPCDLPSYPIQGLPVSLVEMEGIASLLVMLVFLASMFYEPGLIRGDGGRKTD